MESIYTFEVAPYRSERKKYDKQKKETVVCLAEPARFDVFDSSRATVFQPRGFLVAVCVQHRMIEGIWKRYLFVSPRRRSEWLLELQNVPQYFEDKQNYSWGHCVSCGEWDDLVAGHCEKWNEKKDKCKQERRERDT